MCTRLSSSSSPKNIHNSSGSHRIASSSSTMQQKRKKHHHSRPIVPKHSAASNGVKSTASTAQHELQQHQQKRQKQKQHQQHQHNVVHVKDQTNSLFGDLQHAAQQQGSLPCKPLQQSGRMGVSIQHHHGQPNKKRKLQNEQQAVNNLKQLIQPQPQQPQHQQQQEGNNKQHISHRNINERCPAVNDRNQQPRHKQQWTELQQPKQHQADSQQQQQQQQQLLLSQQPAQHVVKHHQQNCKKRKHIGQPALNSKAAPAAAAPTSGACSDTAGPVGSPSSEAAAATATGHGCAAPGVVAAAAPKASSKPWHPQQPTAIGSNWQALQQQLKQQAATQPRWRRKRKDPALVDIKAMSGVNDSSNTKQSKQIDACGHNKGVTPIVAMDCEMVGVGTGGDRDSLARVSIVNASGNVLYDSYVGQREPVTDYRTWVSGITPANLVGAPDISTVQKKVTELLQGRVLVGHGLKKDLSVLMLSHPRKNIRDTAKYRPFMFSKGGKCRPRALKQLAQQELGLSIQEGQHSSIDDARAALYLYQQHAGVWEKALKTPQGIKQLPTANRPLKKKRVDSYSLRDVKDDPLADL